MACARWKCASPGRARAANRPSARWPLPALKCAAFATSRRFRTTAAVRRSAAGSSAVSGAAISQPESIGSINAIVAMIHVTDVERSAEFYRLLGFEIGNQVPKMGPPHWAWLYAPKAADWKRGPNLMLTRTERALAEHDVLFYLYATDLVALRNELMGRGVAVSEIGYPDYLPEG